MQEVYLQALQPANERYQELETLLSVPEVTIDRALSARYSAELRTLLPWVQCYRKLSACAAELDSVASVTDIELLPLAEEEERRLRAKQEANFSDARALLASRQDNRPFVLTVRAKFKEDAMYAHRILDVYRKYLDTKGIAYTYSLDPTGGAIEGSEGYGSMSQESGCHKWRTNDTHVVTVAVLPKESDTPYALDYRDVRIDIFCSSGKGGQNVNKVETAVRVTHIPTGMVVTCQDERSQLMNKRRALAELESRLTSQQQRAKQKANNKAKEDLLADMSNPIRVWDEYEDIVRDTRVAITLPLKQCLKGNIHGIIDALLLHRWTH